MRVERVTNFIDVETGQVVDTSITTEATRYTRNRPYVKIYVDDALQDLILLSGTEHSLLYYCFKEANFSNEFPLINIHKVKFAAQMKISTRTVDNALCFLVKSNLILRLSPGFFKLNPKYFAKGKDKSYQDQG